MERTETLPTTSDPGSGPTADVPAGSGPPAEVPAGSGPAADVPVDRRPPHRPDPDRPGWVRPALAVLLLGTGLLYLWGLGGSGWANAYYSAAAQAGSENWTAFFYGSSDAANSITVDKTPASLWLMALSVRVFGLTSWSILVPQALLGVATVGVLYATVRRWHGPAAGLVAGAVLALTPVATLMFRFNNPDALLALLLTAAAYATVRALETASTRWIALAGVLVGFGFLTKMLQAFLVVPVLAGVYLVAAPTGLWRRIRQLLLAGAGLVAAAGWWVAIVELVPAGARPYVGGSQTNSVLELTLGYNGLGRLTGDEVGSVGPRGGGPFSAQSGPLRMFGTEVGGQVSWLLPAALILLVAGLVLAGRAGRTDRTRAGLLLWGGWLVVTGVVFSFMSGIFHAYYTVALAPAVGALVGIGATLLWRRAGAASGVAGKPGGGPPGRWGWFATGALALALGVTAWWSWRLLGRSPDWYPWLRTVVLVAGLAGALLVGLAGRFRRGPLVAVALAVGVLVGLAGPLAYSVRTAATPHTGAIPSAGPAVQGGLGGGGLRTRLRAGAELPGGGLVPDLPGAGADDRTGPVLGQLPGLRGGGRLPGGGNRLGGVAGLLDAREPSAELRALLESDSEAYTWVAATVGSNNASGYQLATGEPVMAVGGFNGSDPSPTLAQFQRYVADGRIHWFVGGGGLRANGGSDASREIASWVAGTFESRTVDGVTVYDLSSGRQGPA
ncbi:glycosyltransferase family 39 protein [Micromonospora inyonensis]|uniref:4-amino-4-deoxy-L-arabinose transferase n=1 Tax=Micromonospora inyonensis TaxID=47866 RepID=A0A1C6SH08_9ACTN|nr:glycosyltransferase family 39 protein [Micromonospora inyonensis]SCL28786.1 4-amino-4-deoxy-L-arabinose transferase [Micromonospora inyonensis]